MSLGKEQLASFGVYHASKHLGIENIAVEFKPGSFFSPDINAIFKEDSYKIVFNKDWINTAQNLEILKCSFHETRHAYQKACIDFPDIMKCDSQSTDQWKQEFTNYIKPNTYGYETQAIEMDAIQFSEKLLTELIRNLTL